MSAVVKSRLYDCEVVHVRHSPKHHSFRYRYFTFCLDLDEIENLSSRSLLFGRALWKLFRFETQDFIFSGKAGDLKLAVCDYARANGLNDRIERVELVAHMRTLGYAFNPAAFYFCYSKDNRPLCAILEVTNTYREKKAYFLGKETFAEGAFHSSADKHFYVSPFVDLESKFVMRLNLPSDTLRLQIDSKQGDELMVHSLVIGNRVAITDLTLLMRFLSYPLITLGVMAKIHYQALRLFFKRIPYLKKSDRMELQKGGLI